MCSTMDIRWIVSNGTEFSFILKPLTFCFVFFLYRAKELWKYHSNYFKTFLTNWSVSKKKSNRSRNSSGSVPVGIQFPGCAFRRRKKDNTNSPDSWHPRLRDKCPFRGFLYAFRAHFKCLSGRFQRSLRPREWSAIIPFTLFESVSFCPRTRLWNIIDPSLSLCLRVE